MKAEDQQSSTPNNASRLARWRTFKDISLTDRSAPNPNTDPSDLSEPTYADALPDGPAHRRGAGINPANRFETVRLHVLGEELDRRATERAEEADHDRPLSAPRAEREIFIDATKSVINRVEPTSDVPFSWTLNPYRGCEHGCVYCFARPYHEYLGFSSGLDFETKIITKPDAPDLLQRELANHRWIPEPIVMSAITDIYQHVEHEHRIARECLEVLAACNQPVSTMTKSALVLRDTDLWQRLAHHQAGQVTVTLVTLDAALAKSLEPRAGTPAGRLRTVRELSDAGIPVNVNIAPIIPGLTDTELPSILEAAADHGAVSARFVMLRLPYQVKAIFFDWLARSVHPDRARKVESHIRQTHGGTLYDSSRGNRRGSGKFVDQIHQLFEVHTRRHHLNESRTTLNGAHFRRPMPPGQLALFQ